MRETCSWELPPAIAHGGVRRRPSTSGGGAGTTVRLAAAVAAPALAEMETVVSAATAPVVTLNEAVLPPAGIVTTVGTDATPGFDDESATAVPPDHAGAPIVTVPATDRPPMVLGDPSVRLVTSTTGSTRSSVHAEKPRSVTVIETGVAVVTRPVVTGNVAVLAPSGMRTDAGTEARPESELETRTGRPPTGAASLRNTEAVTVLPPGVEVKGSFTSGRGRPTLTPST